MSDLSDVIRTAILRAWHIDDLGYATLEVKLAEDVKFADEGCDEYVWEYHDSFTNDYGRAGAKGGRIWISVDPASSSYSGDDDDPEWHVL